jgi:small-conductance mechanosensitive channel
MINLLQVEDGFSPIVMITSSKLPNALYALQGVLIKRRQMAHKGAPATTIAQILDSAEMLPRLIASETDETDQFRRYLVNISEKHECAFILQRFDEPAPPKW